MAGSWSRPKNIELRGLGSAGFAEKEGRDSILHFELGATAGLSD